MVAYEFKTFAPFLSWPFQHINYGSIVSVEVQVNCGEVSHLVAQISYQSYGFEKNLR